MDNEWRKDTLPFEKIFVPDDKLPDAEADNSDVQLTLNEMVCFQVTSYVCLCLKNGFHKSLQEQKWSDLALSTLAPDIATIADQLNVSSV